MPVGGVLYPSVVEQGGLISFIAGEEVHVSIWPVARAYLLWARAFDALIGGNARKRNGVGADWHLSR